jgi:hypothetical protein
MISHMFFGGAGVSFAGLCFPRYRFVVLGDQKHSGASPAVKAGLACELD